MLRRIELEVLATVDPGDTISELATKLDHSEDLKFDTPEHGVT